MRKDSLPRFCVTCSLPRFIFVRFPQTTIYRPARTEAEQMNRLSVHYPGRDEKLGVLTFPPQRAPECSVRTYYSHKHTGLSSNKYTHRERVHSSEPKADNMTLASPSVCCSALTMSPSHTEDRIRSLVCHRILFAVPPLPCPLPNIKDKIRPLACHRIVFDFSLLLCPLSHIEEDRIRSLV